MKNLILLTCLIAGLLIWIGISLQSSTWQEKSLEYHLKSTQDLELKSIMKRSEANQTLVTDSVTRQTLPFVIQGRDTIYLQRCRRQVSIDLELLPDLSTSITTRKKIQTYFGPISSTSGNTLCLKRDLKIRL